MKDLGAVVGRWRNGCTLKILLLGERERKNKEERNLLRKKILVEVWDGMRVNMKKGF